MESEDAHESRKLRLRRGALQGGFLTARRKHSEGARAGQAYMMLR